MCGQRRRARLRRVGSDMIVCSDGNCYRQFARQYVTIDDLLVWGAP